MKQFADPNGIEYTAETPESAAAFARLASSYMGYRRDTTGILRELITADPNMPMAICARGYFSKLIGSAKHAERAKQASQDLNAKLDAVGANERERRHAAVLSAWTGGQITKATEILESILLDTPRDGLALSLTHFMHFYSGDARRLRDSMARVLPLWPEDHADYGYLLGMYAFGLEESGDYARAEQFGRRAVDRNPSDAWSVHAVAHVLEMTERHEDGIAWIRGLEPSWSTVNNFRFHLYWHQCLFHLERGEFDAALRIYDEQVISEIESDFYLDICNASSLLWRLEMFGVNVGDRWHKVAEFSKRRLQDEDLIFVSLHYLMALVADGDDVAARQLIDHIRAWSTLDTTQAHICAAVGVSLAEGLYHARRGEFREAVAKIEKVRYDLDQIGGSRAQRDLFHMVLLNSAREAGETLKARALFAERLGNKPHSSWAWKNYSTVLHDMGQETQAQKAAATARELLARH